MSAEYNRMVLLGLFDEFDVKQKFSAKYRVWNSNGTPCDILGVFMSRIGENNNSGHYGARDERLVNKLQVSKAEVFAMYREIDRYASTNESIKALFIKIFEANPIAHSMEGANGY